MGYHNVIDTSGVSEAVRGQMEQREAAAAALAGMEAGGPCAGVDADYQPMVGRGVSDDEVFTAADWRDLESLRGSLMPEGAAYDLLATRNAIRRAADEAERTILASRYLDEYGRVSDDVAARVEALYDKAHRSKGAAIPSERFNAIRNAGEHGLIDDADRRIMREQGDARRRAFEMASELFRHVAGVRSGLQSLAGAMLTGEQKAAAVERWNRDDEFNRARAEYKRRYSEARSLNEKAELRAKYPEFA